MKSFPVLPVICSLMLTASVRGQWQTTTYSLKGGFNGIYLSGDAPQDTLDTLLPPQVTEVWRWNSSPSQAQFMESPLVPSAGTPQWSVWRRGMPDQSNFSKLTGQTAYLVKCTGTTTNNYSVAIKQAPLMPRAAWVRDGANLLGFPSLKNGSSFPSFSAYFAPFPAVIASNLKIFKYVGGELGAANPIQIFSPTMEQLDRTKAYWFSAEVGGEYYAPLEITVSTAGGLSFGSTGSVVTATIRNRTAAAVTLTMAVQPSESAPGGQTAIAGPVPLTRRTFDTATASWVESPLSGSQTQAIPARGEVELKFGIDRSAMGGATKALYASFLKLTDSSNLMEIFVPVSASKASLAGLWMGDISLTNVSNKVSNGAKATAAVSGGGVTGISVSGGGFGYVSAPLVSVEVPVSGAAATAVATVVNGAVTAIDVTSSGSGYTRSPRVTIEPPAPLTGTGVPENSQFRLRTLLHVTEGGNATMLPQAFLGQLAAAPYDVGICSLESSLKQDAKATAQRFVSAHLPFDSGPISSQGSVSLPGSVSFNVNIGFDNASNPFVHQYHPDHDNKNPRGDALGAGVESYNVTRACTFNFTGSPPAGSGVTSGWGSTVIGGTYVETITGIHKQPLQVSGNFELRRASEISTLSP